MWSEPPRRANGPLVEDGNAGPPAFMLRFLIDEPTSAAVAVRWASTSPNGAGDDDVADRGADDLDEDEDARLRGVRATASVGASHCV